MNSRRASAAAREPSVSVARASVICWAPAAWACMPSFTWSNRVESPCTLSITSANWLLIPATRSTPVFTSAANRSISSTPVFTACCICSTSRSMSSVATAVWSASRRISRATTMKPWPYSPAFSASIAALIESRFVWSATFVIVVITMLMSSARWRIAASRSENWAVDCSRLAIDSPTSARFSRPASATWAVSAATPATSCIVPKSSRPVTEICRLATAASLVLAPSDAIADSCCLPAAESCRAVAFRSRLACFTCDTIPRRLAVIAPTSRSSCPVSSPPRMSIEPVRSPCATRREAATARPIRRVRLRVSQSSRPSMTAMPAAASAPDTTSGHWIRPTRSARCICITTVHGPLGTLADA